MTKVLLIDDSNLSRRLLRRSLGEEFTYLEAEDGIAGLETFYLERPDLVILDITMPGMNGMEVLKQIRNVDPTARVVIGSADVQEFSRQEAEALGARGFLLKPFDAREVQQVVREVLTQEEQ